MKNLLPALCAAAALAQCTAASASVAAGKVCPIQEGYVDANGVLIYYAEFGHGSPLVVLHGGELYREVCGSDGEFVIDGNLKSVEYLDRRIRIALSRIEIAKNQKSQTHLLQLA
jgi:hypothetical protein